MLMNNPYRNKNIIVLGLAKSGYYVSKLLDELGAKVTLNDVQDLTDNVDAQELESLGIRVISGGHPLSLMDQNYDLLVKNPGIPYENIIVKQALEREIPIVTEVEIASSVMDAHKIGITGTNGKTTTTLIIKEMLSLNREKGSVYALGNIGVPASKIALEVEKNDDLVMELSSFQLMGTPTFRPEIAVITNITEEHIDYHGSKEAYEEAKLNLIKNQTEEDYLIYNDDQPHLRELIFERNQAKLVPFSSTRYLTDGVSVKDDLIYYREEKVAAVADVFLKGQHNLENILAAVGVAKIKNISNQNIQKAIQQFKGVKHRTQFVGKWDERTYYNDSKATNIESTVKALRGFDQPIILLAGGLSRGNGFDTLVPALKENVKVLITFGETAGLIKDAGEKAGIQTIKKADNMEDAVKFAYELSEPGDVILLSPAAASWDQYKSFEERGDRFIEAVQKLVKVDTI